MSDQAPVTAGGGLHPVAVIARILLITERRVQQLARLGHIPKALRGRYDLLGSVQGYIRFLQDTMKDQTGDGALHEEKALTQKVRREIAEMELAERRGDLIPREEVEAALLAVASPIALRLDAIPPKAGPEVRAASSDAEAEAIIRRHIDEAREGIADAGEGYFRKADQASVASGGARAGASSIPTPAAAERQRVGGRGKKA